MNHHRLALLALAALLPLTAPAQQMPLNDTGQDRCYDGANLVACSEDNTGDEADYPRQDGRFGRDAQAAVEELAKTGGGNAGFDFTKLDADGNDLPADAADWSCVRDNVTGRVWEVKTADNKDDIYTWADATTDHAADVNTAQLCGYTDWRLPSRRELLSIVDHDTSSPAIDSNYFPNTVSFYWSADTYAPGPGFAWVVVFDDGDTFANGKPVGNRVRLVRGGQLFDALTSYDIDITVDPTDAGTASCEPNPVPAGGSSTCTATPESGYAFLGWSGDCTGETCELSNVTEAQSVTATFGLIVDGQCGAADGGLFTAAPDTGLCTAGTASAVDDTDPAEFTWSCQGENTGDDAQCSAVRGYTVPPRPGPTAVSIRTPSKSSPTTARPNSPSPRTTTTAPWSQAAAAARWPVTPTPPSRSPPTARWMPRSR